jgi:hypothetical protein
MSKENLVTRIKAYGATRTQGAYLSAALPLMFLTEEWDAHKPDEAVRDFFVIRLVTLVETFVRRWAAEVIDTGSPFAERAGALVERLKIKINFELSNELYNQRFTMGDLFAHSIHVGSIADIHNVFSTLLGTDIFDLLAGARDSRTGYLIVKDVGAMKKNLAVLFELRHKSVHEMPLLKKASPIDDVQTFFRTVEEFTRAFDEAVALLVGGPVPQTQVEMNVLATRELEEGKKAVSHLVASTGWWRDEEFRAVIEGWKGFAGLCADWESGMNEELPGSGAGMEWSLAMARLTKHLGDYLGAKAKNEAGRSENTPEDFVDIL